MSFLCEPLVPAAGEAELSVGGLVLRVGPAEERARGRVGVKKLSRLVTFTEGQLKHADLYIFKHAV